ncbi:UPF0606 protein KIAA1549L homolog isoform X2 [Phyllobates terribilis]|uniref:UPF0606 protein KIAA1549L homolog isoform X2 n=1 Tax=Phyllobates terribilis TaxID=111132 RepID=UPI003CCA92B7
MSPAEKWLAGAGQGVLSMVAQEGTVRRSPPPGTARARAGHPSLLLVVALIAALQPPVQGSPTVPPDAGIFNGSWAPEELSSSAASEILASYGQDEIENTTYFLNGTSTSKKIDDTRAITSIQDNIIVQFEEIVPSESLMPSPFQPTNPGLNDTSMTPFLTLHPYNSFSTGEGGFSSSSLSSPSSSLPSSSPPPYQSSLSVTNISFKSSSTVPYFEVTEEEVLTQDTTIDIVNSSSIKTSNSVSNNATSLIETIENGTTDLVKENQSLEATQASWHTVSATDATSGIFLEQTSIENVPPLSLETSTSQTIYTLPFKSISPTSTKSNFNSFSKSYKSNNLFNTPFSITVDVNSVESQQVETRTMMESGSHVNTATYVPMTQDKSSYFQSLSTEQLSSEFIDSSSYYFPDTTTIQSAGEKPVEVASFSLESSTSNTMVSTMSVTTAALLNPSTVLISVQPKDNTHVEHTIGSSLSNELSTMIYKTETNTDDTMSNNTDLLTGNSHSQTVNSTLSLAQSMLYSEEISSRITVSILPGTNVSSTATEEKHSQSVPDDKTSWTLMTPSESPSEVSLPFKPSTATYSTNIMTKVLQTDQESSHNTNENKNFSSTSTFSTFEDLTSDISVSMKVSTTESEEASSVKSATFSIPLDTTSDMVLWTTKQIVSVTSPLETTSSITLASEIPLEISTLTMIIDTSTDTEIQQTNSIKQSTHIATSRTEDLGLQSTEPESITSIPSMLATTPLQSTFNLGVSEKATKIITDITSATPESTSIPKSNTSVQTASFQTNGSESLTFSWVSSPLQEISTSTDTFEGNSYPYSSYIATSTPNNTTPIRLTQFESSAIYQSSSLPTSNFDEISNYFNTNSEQSTSNIEERLEATSPLEVTTRSTVIIPSSTSTLWTITDSEQNTLDTVGPSKETSPLESTTGSSVITPSSTSALWTITDSVQNTSNTIGPSEETSPSESTTGSTVIIPSSTRSLWTITNSVQSTSSTIGSSEKTSPSESKTGSTGIIPSSTSALWTIADSVQSTSNTIGPSEETSPSESTTGSTVIIPSSEITLWTITDKTIETATNVLPFTIDISTTLFSSEFTNMDTKTESLLKSAKWDISSPQSLSSTVTAPYPLTQPNVSATDYKSSTTQITSVSDYIRSLGTIMLTSSPSTDSSVLSTVQATSRNFEFQTSSNGLQSTNINSPSTVASLLSQLATQTESSPTTTVDMVNSNRSSTHIEDTKMSMLHTTSHLSSTTIKSTHSSSFTPLTTTNFPTNISNSLSTVSSVVSSAEVSTVSTAGNATQNLTSTEKPSPSSVTLTSPTTHVSPSIIYTLLSTQFTKSDQISTLGVITTHFTPINHTTHRPTIVVSPTTLQTMTFTSTPSTTTHSASTDTVTTVSDATKMSTVLPHTITSSTIAATMATTLRTYVASVRPATSTTIVISTAPTTILSTSIMSSSVDCKPSSETMVKTVLTLMPMIALNESILQKFEDFLNLTLYRALNQSIKIIVNSSSQNVASQSLNMTVGYSVSVNSSLYVPSAIVDVLTGNGIFNVTELKRLISALQSVPVMAESWEPAPHISFRIKTVLKLMGTGANVHTCVYVRNMEQRLKTAFERAELTSTGGISSNLSVQILSTSKENQILTLIYVVKNYSNVLNGATASSLLNVLSGEEVGYYLGDPPSIIAEPLYYPNIDISASTINNWVYTVIQGVDNQLLGSNNQSFARLMEERFAKLFQESSQQSRRFRRATTVGSYTVQMVKMQRLDGPNNLAELTYYAVKDGQPILGTIAAKQLSTIDPQNMALALGYFVKVQANSVVQKPPNNLWIIAAVLAPIAVVTVIIIIITAVLCRKNKSDFKSDNISNLPPRTKPVQGFDYAKQHLGQQGGDEEMLPVTQETVVPSLNLSQERNSTKDGSTEKMLKSSDNRKSRSPCENGSVISNESEEASSDRSTPQKVMAQHRATKEEACKRNVPISDEEEGNVHFDKNKMMSDPFDSSSGSVQLIAIKPVSIPPALTMSERNQEMSIINGEVNKALKQKSDIEHYRNKLRLKAKRKGYYDFPPLQSKSLNDRKRKIYDKTQMEIDNVLDAGTDTSSPFAEPKNRQTALKNHPYRSRQSLNSPSPGETEMDLLVTRERPRRGIRNSGYDTEPEMIEETNIDRVKQARTYIKSRQAKGHSETSTLSSQPSIDEVRQQMHMLLEEAFSLASAGHGGPKRQADPYASVQHMPYTEVVTSAPGTMSRPRMQWVPTYGPEMYQYSLPRPNYRFSQLPEMVMGSPPPPIPPRTGPVAVPSLRRSTSDMANKSRMPEPGGNDQGPGNSMPAVFAIPGNRAGYSGYYIPQPPASYRNQAWMSYSGENDAPGQWADSVPLPGYIEAYPRSRYPQNSPSRLPRQFGQPVNLHPSLDHATGPSIGASQQSLADTDTPDASITNLSTAALVKAIREEVAKLAKKQTDMFEFQV